MPSACLFAALICVLQSSGQAYDVPPAAEANDVISVYWNIAPMVPGSIGELLTYINLYHASVSFSNGRTGATSFMQFVAPGFGPGILFPKLSLKFSQDCWQKDFWTTTLQWADQGIVEFVDAKDTGYKWADSTHVATITGAVYNSMRIWAAGAQQKYTKYYMFGVSYPNQAPKADIYEEYAGKNAYTGAGGTEIDNDQTAPTGLNAQQCQNRCSEDGMCDCVTLDTNTGKCWKRENCIPQKFDDNWSNYNTWMKVDPDAHTKPFTCMQFAYLVLSKVQALAGDGVFLPGLPGVFRDYPLVYSSVEPVEIDPQESQSLQLFCNFYKQMNDFAVSLGSILSGKIDINQLITMMIQLMGNKVVFHHEGRYYQFQPAFPYVGYQQGYAPLPGAQRQPAGFKLTGLSKEMANLFLSRPGLEMGPLSSSIEMATLLPTTIVEESAKKAFMPRNNVANITVLTQPAIMV